MNPTGAFRASTDSHGPYIFCECGGREGWPLLPPSEAIASELKLNAIVLVAATDGRFITSELPVRNGQRRAGALLASFEAEDVPFDAPMLVLRRAATHAGCSSWRDPRDYDHQLLMQQWAELAGCVGGADNVIDLASRMLLATYNIARLA